jgi:glycine cleavage system H lipoate-binding protein
LFKIELADEAELKELMDEEKYKKFIESAEE